MMWHDGYTLSSHSYLLMMVSIMYDRAVFLTNEEYEQKYHTSLDILSIIEKPQVYLLPHCPSNDQQILNIEERLQDILNLNLEKHHIFIVDFVVQQVWRFCSLQNVFWKSKFKPTI